MILSCDSIPPTNKSRVRDVPRSKAFLCRFDVTLNRAHAAIHFRRYFFSNQAGAQSAHDLELTRGERLHFLASFIRCRRSSHIFNAAFRHCAFDRAFDFPRPALPPARPMVERYAVMGFGLLELSACDFCDFIVD
jgi:hypothetical protein